MNKLNELTNKLYWQWIINDILYTKIINLVKEKQDTTAIYNRLLEIESRCISVETNTKIRILEILILNL
jgi:hypothetical protein